MCVCICNKYVCVTIVMEGGIWGYRCERHLILGELFYDQLRSLSAPLKLHKLPFHLSTLTSNSHYALKKS